MKKLRSVNFWKGSWHAAAANNQPIMAFNAANYQPFIEPHQQQPCCAVRVTMYGMYAYKHFPARSMVAWKRRKENRTHGKGKKHISPCAAQKERKPAIRLIEGGSCALLPLAPAAIVETKPMAIVIVSQISITYAFARYLDRSITLQPRLPTLL